MTAAPDLAAAARRLRGALVATPIVGGVRLAGCDPGRELRVVPEVLQPGGTIEYRGISHFLLRQLGRLKGVVVAGSDRRLCAGAIAAAQHRLPCVAVPEAALDDRVTRWLRDLGAETEPGADPDGVARARGFTRLPGMDDAEFRTGIATLGLQLAAELSADCERVFVAPAPLAAPIAAGLAAGGRALPVSGADASLPPERAATLRAEVLQALRLDCGDASAAALHAALESAERAPCVVLAE